MSEDLKSKIVIALEQAVGGAISILAKNGHPSLYKKNEPDAFKKIRNGEAALFSRLAESIMVAIDDAGYTNKAPTGDLRVQLTAVARQLKACSFSNGHSGGGSVEADIRDAVYEAKAEVKSEIGEMLLEALTS